MKIESEDKIKDDTFYCHSKAQTIINESDIDDNVLNQSILQVAQVLGKCSGWIIDSVTEHNINILRYNSLAGGCFIKSPKKLDHPRKGLINIYNIDDNEWFKWCIVRYLHPADHDLRRITKADKDFAKMLYFKDIQFPVKVRDIHKIEKKNSIDLIVFGYENKEKHPIYVLEKCCKEKHIDLLLLGEEGKWHYSLIKDFNMFVYHHTLHCGGKHFCQYCLQGFSTEVILKHQIKDSFKSNRKQRIMMPKIDFESILVPEDNEKENPN